MPATRAFRAACKEKQTQGGEGMPTPTCKRRDPGREALPRCACNLYLALGTELLRWCPRWPARLLFFPGRNRITSTKADAFSSHALAGSQMLGPFWVFPFQFTHVILWQERSPELTRDLRSFIRNGAGWSLTSPLLPATLVPQGPCWENSALSLSGLPQMRRGCACFPAASPKSDAREKCPCLSAGPPRRLHFADLYPLKRHC